VFVTDVRIWSEARPHTYAEIDAPDGVDDQREFAAIAVDGLFSLAEGLFEPFAVNVELACCDAEFGYPLSDPRPATRFHQLRVAAPPETIEIPDIWNDLVVDRTDRLDRDVVTDWLATLLVEQQCPEQDTRTGWLELIVEALRARLPEETGRGVESGRDELLIPEGPGVIRYPVERSGDALWVSGPLEWRSGTSPFDVRIVNEAGALSLWWARNWSPWIDADGAGRPDVEAAISRLSARGWDVRPADPI
jgi:hypothetical protein